MMKTLVFGLLIFFVLGQCEGLSIHPNATRCKKNNCLNKGICIVDLDKKSICVCNPFFHGPRCEDHLPILPNATLCVRNICKNGGICIINEDNKTLCLCLKPYFGKLCQFQNKCLMLPCKSGSTCINLHNGKYTCHCPAGVTGPKCGENQCRKKTCKNGGRCVPHMHSYYCICKPGFSGSNCQIRCDITLDLMIAIDASGGFWKFLRSIHLAMNMVKAFDVDNGKVRIGVITFAKSVFLHFDMKTYNNKSDILHAMYYLRYHYVGGPTFTFKALKFLRNIAFTVPHGDRRKVKNCVFIISDGYSRCPRLTKSSALALKLSNVKIYAFGLGNVRMQELCSIASHPSTTHVILRYRYTFRNPMDILIKDDCKVLECKEKCQYCTEDCHCPSGMKCCNGCCKNSVVLEC